MSTPADNDPDSVQTEGERLLRQALAAVSDYAAYIRTHPEFHVGRAWDLEDDESPDGHDAAPPQGRWLHAHLRTCAVQQWFQNGSPGEPPECTCDNESEGPDDGHTWRISYTSRGSYSVVGDPHHTDAPDFDGPTHTVKVRAWSLRDALRKAAELPFDQLMAEPHYERNDQQ